MLNTHCTLQQSLQQATQAIAQSLSLSPSEAAIEARVLLQKQLQQDHAWLISHYQDALSAHDQQAFQALVARRQQGEPIAYITGQREFFGLLLQVTPATLIPRADTELLVEVALDLIALDQTRHILDLGTGSGAIAIAIAKHRPLCQVIALDASIEAIQIAQQNALRHHVQNIQFMVSDWFSNVPDSQFDLIVSNPPYIASDDPHLQQADLSYEPISALVAEDSGLADLHHIMRQAKRYLSATGVLLLEHGYQQASAIQQYAQQIGFSKIRQHQDIAGHDRVSEMSF
jgi:release factor glutamine methyltransferase